MSDDIQYAAIPLINLFPDIPLPGNLYICINDKFIKYKSKDDQITKNRYQEFIYKKVENLFITVEDLTKYKDWIRGLKKKEINEVTKNVGKQHKTIIEKHFEIKNDILSFITKDDIPHDIKIIITKTRDLINDIKKQKTSEKFMLHLISYDQGIADHATNVASLSVFLALNIGYAQQILLENIYLGALLHDYGKTKIDPKILENPDCAQYAQELRTHPQVGKKALLLDSGFSTEILKIVEEHHERADGKGYPKGLKKNQIYDLSKIVSIANIFDNLVMKLDGPIPIRQKKAIRMLEQDNGKVFDFKLLEKSIKALKEIV